VVRTGAGPDPVSTIPRSSTPPRDTLIRIQSHERPCRNSNFRGPKTTTSQKVRGVESATRGHLLFFSEEDRVKNPILRSQAWRDGPGQGSTRPIRSEPNRRGPARNSTNHELLRPKPKMDADLGLTRRTEGRVEFGSLMRRVGSATWSNIRHPRCCASQQGGRKNGPTVVKLNEAAATLPPPRSKHGAFPGCRCNFWAGRGSQAVWRQRGR